MNDPHNDRIEKLTNEVSRLSSLVVESITETKANYKHLAETVHNHSKELWGTDGKPGLAVKVDRIEQVEKQKTWIVKTIGAVVAGLGLERFFAHLK